MPITLEVNGTEFTNFTRAGVTVALDTLANDFSFEAAMPFGQSLPVKGGDKCTVLVDEVLVMTGFVENVTGRYSANEHTIVITGRDKTADFIDSTIEIIDDLRSPISLKQIIERVIEHIGADIIVIDNANPKEFNKAEDIVSPKSGDNAYSFVEKYAQKRQVILTSNANGDIVITNSEATPSVSVLQNVVGNSTNNILESSWSYMTNNLFNKYIQKGQLDPVALDKGGSKSADGLVSQDGETTDSDIRAGRQMVVVAGEGFSKEQLQLRAEWSKKIRQSRSLAYSCTAQGFKNSNGGVWQVNQLVSVVDEFADISRDLLLNSIQFLYGADGSRSLLSFVEKNAYELIANEPKPTGSNQDAFIS